jgi:thiamine kinase-like enzyme
VIKKYEAEALKRVLAWSKEESSPSSIVTVPEIFVHDDQTHTLIMEDCGRDILTLKDFLLSITLSNTAAALAPSIGTALGTFLARMHQWSRSNPGGILDLFSEHELARNLSAWVTHGRMVETLDGTANLPKLEDPRLRVSEDDLKAIAEAAEYMQARIKAAKDVVSPAQNPFPSNLRIFLQFVMGDFYPGNIMVVLNADSTEVKHIYIFDWELAKPGLPGVELGQFCAEMIQLQRFSKEKSAKPAATVLSAFMSAYSSALEGTSATEERQQIARDVLMHCGSHLITWTPRVATWENKDITRKTVLEGAELVIKASRGEDQYLKESIAGPLLD